jgi:hypothetical protein
MRPNNFRPALLICWALLFVAIAAASLAPGGSEAQSANQFQNPYGWRKLAQFTTDISASFAGINTLVPSQGRWAAHTATRLGCGRCGFIPRDIVLQHTIDGRRVPITGSNTLSSFSGDPLGLANISYVEPYLVWYQPGPGSGRPDSHTPGQFNCTVCQYNTETGTGGSITDILPGLQVQETVSATLRPIAHDPSGTGRVLFSLQRYSNSSQTGSSLYIGNLKTREVREIALTENPVAIYEGAVYGDTAAWSQVARVGSRGRLFTLNIATGQIETAQNVAEGAYDLHAGPGNIFFSLPSERLSPPQRYDLATRQTSPLSDTQTFGYSVYGDRLARRGSEKGTVELVEWRRNRVLATWNVASNESLKESLNVGINLSLNPDKLLFSVNGLGGTGTLHAHHIGIAWLDAAHAQFLNVWRRGDGPVNGQTARSWLWGPQPIFTGWEPYAGLPGGVRQVQYFDKSRMEVNNPAGNVNDPFFVTNGLLVVEMIGGGVRLGETEISARQPATLTVVGDPRKDNPLTPSYAVLRGVASIEGDNKAPNRTGQFVTEAMDVDGKVSPETQNARAARYVIYVAETGHNIPDIFNTYLQRMKQDYGYDWVFAMGYPITEAYWTKMRVEGRDYPVLIQAYQRRVMTYTPAFPVEWRIQQGNVGQHYFEWRYTLTNTTR